MSLKRMDTVHLPIFNSLKRPFMAALFFFLLFGSTTFSIGEEMPDLYRLVDVVVYPSSTEEPFGLAMLEAMSSGKPIIVTESGGMPEIIKDDVNGYVVPKRNHEALAECIIHLLSDEKFRKGLGGAGRKQVEDMYTREIYATKV